MPPLDTIQNVMETSARIVDGQIEVNFTRLLNTGDTVQDFNLADNCFYLLVASGRVANFNTSMIMQHTFRASSSDQFCFCPPLSSPPSSSPPIPMPTSTPTPTPTPTPTGGAGMVASKCNDINSGFFIHNICFRSVSMAASDDRSYPIPAVIVTHMSRHLQLLSCKNSV